ncbi:MAG: YbbR-like domain-containing protein [Planctomycetota bacterium]|nr:YbbR-like domain-containing protein [Planctomycetota bacterium]
MPASGPLLRFLRAVLWEDPVLKFVCLLLAVLSFFYIDGELSDEREFVVPIKEAGLKLPEGLELAPDSKFPPLRVKVRGPRRRLQYVSSENIKPNLQDLVRGLSAGENLIVVKPDQVEVAGAGEMRVIKVDPEDGFTVKALGLSKRVLPVKLRRQGNPAAGYNLINAIIQPKEVLVTSTSDLSNVENVWTEPIDLTGRNDSFQVPDARIARFVTVGEKDIEIRCSETVTVSLQVSREEISRVIEAVPVRALAPVGAAMYVEPSNLNVTVTGPPDAVAAMSVTDLQLYVEWPAEWDLQQPAGHAYPAQNVQVRAVSPGRITVKSENNQALPAVKVRGVITAPPKQ